MKLDKKTNILFMTRHKKNSRLFKVRETVVYHIWKLHTHLKINKRILIRNNNNNNKAFHLKRATINEQESTPAV